MAASRQIAELWHRRFEHLGYNNLSQLSRTSKWWEALWQQLIASKHSRSRSPSVKHAPWQNIANCQFLIKTAKAQGSWSWCIWMYVDQCKSLQRKLQNTWRPHRRLLQPIRGSSHSHLHQEQKPIQPPQHMYMDAVRALLWRQAGGLKHESLWSQSWEYNVSSLNSEMRSFNIHEWKLGGSSFTPRSV